MHWIIKEQKKNNLPFHYMYVCNQAQGEIHMCPEIMDLDDMHVVNDHNLFIKTAVQWLRQCESVKIT